MKKLFLLGFIFTGIFFAGAEPKPVPTSEVEKQLLSLQQKIAIESKKNELLKLQKENAQLEKEMKPEKIQPAVSPAPIVSSQPQSPYSYISSFPESGQFSMGGEKELELVGISGKRAVVREGEKYFYLTEGQEFRNLQVVKIENDGVYLKDGGKVRFLGLSYTKSLEAVIQTPPPQQQQEKK